MLLETNKFVHCLLIDFSKAFDSVDHIIMINKLKSLKISDNVIQWIVSFLMDRKQFVKMGQKLSFTRVNQSIYCTGFWYEVSRENITASHTCTLTITKYMYIVATRM